MYRFKEIRQLQNRTQEEIANFLNISRASYTNIENGKRDPDTNTLISLSRIFHVSIDYLVGLSETKKESSDSATLLDESDLSLLQAFHAADPSIQTAVLKLLDLSEKSVSELSAT